MRVERARTNFWSEFRFPPDGVVRGILDQQPAEIRLRTKMAVRHAAVNRGVVSLGGFQIIVALVADVTEIGNGDPGGLREQRDLVGADGVARIGSPVPAGR